MEKVINKDLLSYLLLLESDQQKKVLGFIKELIKKDEMNYTAEASEKAIESNLTKSFKDFNNDFESWKMKKKMNLKS